MKRRIAIFSACLVVVAGVIGARIAVPQFRLLFVGSTLLTPNDLASLVNGQTVMLRLAPDEELLVVTPYAMTADFLKDNSQLSFVDRQLLENKYVANDGVFVLVNSQGSKLLAVQSIGRMRLDTNDCKRLSGTIHIQPVSKRGDGVPVVDFRLDVSRAIGVGSR